MSDLINQNGRKKSFEIPIENIGGEFSSFISGKNNKRIFFNGKYGTGKTYFLKKFFEQNKEVYEVFHLFPVHYQVHDNKDISEIIKYDLLVELQKRDKTLFDVDETVSSSDEMKFLVNHLKEKINPKSVIKSILKFSTKASVVDPIAYSVVSTLGKSVDSLFEFDEELQDQIKEKLADQDGIKIQEFVDRITKLNISANDYLDLIILDSIKKYKNKKKSVLIIDDLDRLDPEHLFRILNIFSSHFDIDDKNKYDFDHVIIVGDQNNVKSIFEHKYGKDTDFDGYFDKFFSTSLFNFNNQKAIVSYLPDIVNGIQFGDSNLDGLLEPNGYMYETVFEIVSEITELNKINLRELLKSTKAVLFSVKKGVYNGHYYGHQNKQFLDLSLRLIIDILGGSEERFKNVINTIIEKRPLESKRNYSIPYLRYSYAILSSFHERVPKHMAEGGIHFHTNAPDIILDDGFEERGRELFYKLLYKYVDQGGLQGNIYEK